MQGIFSLTATKFHCIQTVLTGHSLLVHRLSIRDVFYVDFHGECGYCVRVVEGVTGDGVRGGRGGEGGENRTQQDVVGEVSL